MNKTLLILRHEFIQTITRKGFIIMALIVPLIGFAAIGIYQVVQNIGPAEGPDITRIGYIDEVGLFTDTSGNYGDVELVPYDSTDQAEADLLAGSINEYFVIPIDPNWMSKPPRRSWRYPAPPRPRCACSCRRTFSPGR